MGTIFNVDLPPKYKYDSLKGEKENLQGVSEYIYKLHESLDILFQRLHARVSDVAEDPTADNIATVDADGNVTDGGIALSTDGTFAANLDTLVASQKAIKTYTDAQIVIAKTYTDDEITALNLGICRQEKYTEYTAASNGSVAIPHDTTKPQKTEGWEAMTRAMTPLSVSSIIAITITAIIASSASGHIALALFKDDDADAVGVAAEYAVGADQMKIVTFTRYITIADTSEFTIKLNIGDPVGSTITLNGIGGAGLYDGTLISSIRLREYDPT